MVRLLCAVLCPAVVFGRFNDNKTVWGQDDDQIVVTVKADCNMETTQVTVRPDRFSFSCQAWNWKEEWETVVVDFVTREDVVAVSDMACVKRDRTAGYLDQVTCKVDKVHRGHKWDRLTWEEGALDLRYDWSLTETTDDFGEEPGAGAYATPYNQPYVGSEDLVKSYSPAELRAAVDVYDAVFADVRFPFCNLCDFYGQAVTDAAERFPDVLRDEATGLTARFAVLDGFDAHRDLARRVGMTCDYTCPLVVIKKDQPPRKIARPFYGGDLSELYGAIRPVIVEMEPEDADEIALTSRSVVATFKDDSVLDHLFQAMAESHRPHQTLMEINFIKVVDFPESATLGLVAYSPSGEANFLSPADAAATNLTQWLGYATADKILKYLRGAGRCNVPSFNGSVLEATPKRKASTLVSSPREMIARPEISRNEWETAERGTFKVEKFPLSCSPGTTPTRAARTSGRRSSSPTGASSLRSTSSSGTPARSASRSAARASSRP